MKKILTIVLLLISVTTYAQTWENTGTANLQRIPTAKGYLYRNNMGAKGFVYWYTGQQIDSLLTNSGLKDSTYNINKNGFDILDKPTFRNNLGVTTLLGGKADTAAFVHRTGNKTETIDGKKTLTGQVILSGTNTISGPATITGTTSITGVTTVTNQLNLTGITDATANTDNRLLTYSPLNSSKVGYLSNNTYIKNQNVSPQTATINVNGNITSGNIVRASNAFIVQATVPTYLLIQPSAPVNQKNSAIVMRGDSLEFALLGDNFTDYLPWLQVGRNGFLPTKVVYPNGSVISRQNFTLRDTSYATTNFQSFTSKSQTLTGARPGFGFRADSTYGAYLYMNGYKDYQVREDNGTTLLVYTSGSLVSGTYTAASGTASTFTVTIGVTLPSANYIAVPVPRNALAASQGFYVTNKTTTTFDIVTNAALTGTPSFDFTVTRR